MSGQQPMERVLAALRRVGSEPVPRGDGSFSCKCPAHDGKGVTSLSVSPGDSGGVVLHCFSGCETADVVKALGLEMKDLFSSGDGTQASGTRPVNGSAGRRGSGATAKPKRTFDCCEAALEELSRRQGRRPDATWEYHYAAGGRSELCGVVCRWDRAGGGKDIRPLALTDRGWIIGCLPGKRVLYRLPTLQDASTVYVAEGEKATDALCSLGLVATTSPQGSKSAGKADWSALSGKDVVILPDNDEPGTQYADSVLELLESLKVPPASVKVVDLAELWPGLPLGGDVADFCADNAMMPSETLREQLEKLAARTEPEFEQSPQEETSRGTPSWKPFPVELLPDTMRELVSEGAASIGCDESFIALPALATAATAIGNTRRLKIRRGWTAVHVLWFCVVGESGSMKTPAFKLATQPIESRQREQLRLHQQAVSVHVQESEVAKVRLAEWKRNGCEGEMPEQPVAPVCPRSLVRDITVERLALVLQDSWRGVVLSMDELAGWLGSFDRYSGSSAPAEAFWLSVFNCTTAIVDRKTGDSPTIVVPDAAACLIGGCQPGVLRKHLLKGGHKESGMLARLLMACPPRKPKQWTDREIGRDTAARWHHTIDELFKLTEELNEDGEPVPYVVNLSPGALDLFKAYVNKTGKEQVALTGTLAAAWSKLEEYAARFALVFHFTKFAARQISSSEAAAVSADTMRDAIALAEWFKGETLRVYEVIDESAEESEIRQTAELIRRKGEGRASVRELMRWNRGRFPTAADAKASLDALEKHGYGSWQDVASGRKGGRPTKSFHLRDI